MNLLITKLMFWQNRTLNPGTIVEVSDRGLMAAMIGSGRALAADPETAAEYRRMLEPAAPVPLRPVTTRAGEVPIRRLWRR